MNDLIKTDAIPGSEEKLQIMERRAAEGLPVFMPQDGNMLLTDEEHKLNAGRPQHYHVNLKFPKVKETR